jgi:hypothetical protein
MRHDTPRQIAEQRAQGRRVETGAPHHGMHDLVIQQFLERRLFGHFPHLHRLLLCVER